MTLRQRLALATVAVTIPVGLLLLWFDSATQHSVAEQRLAGLVLLHISAERGRCEATPESFGGQFHPPGARGGPQPPPAPPAPPPAARRERARPPVVFAYDEGFVSRNPAAPDISKPLLQAVASRDVATAPFGWRSSDVEVLVAMPWRSGPCAYMLARGTTDSQWGVLPESHLWMLPTASVFVAMLLAVGPVVRRIRGLTAAVKQSAENAYALDIPEGGRDEIGELARTFNAAGREIRSQLAEKDRREQALRQFLANTTHDVMIPLTVLQGHLATLRDHDAGAERDPAISRVLVSAMSEAHYMASLVHNLGVAARLDAVETPLAKDRVDLRALVSRVVGRHRPIARELGVAIESAVPDGPLLVSGDVTLIEQAASNITYNAVRYNRPGGHVAVILECRGEGRFSLRVIDDGPGISKASRARLAERGVRGDEARTRAPEGQGLGLHIAYRVAQVHDFELTLGDSEYGGLEVTIEGPRVVS